VLSGTVSRRVFLQRGALLGGGVTAGLLLSGEQQRAEAFWGWVATTVFGAALGWFVNKLLDTTWNAIPAKAFTEVKAAEPLTVQYGRNTPANVYHNGFATPYVINNNYYFVKPVTLRPYGVDVGTNQYLLTYDLNGTEALQIKREHQDLKTIKNPLVPATRRYEMDKSRHGKVVRDAASKYGYSDGDYRVDYVDITKDNKKQDVYGVGVTVDKKNGYMLLTGKD
jgi:hypothetical protein